MSGSGLRSQVTTVKRLEASYVADAFAGGRGGTASLNATGEASPRTWLVLGGMSALPNAKAPTVYGPLYGSTGSVYVKCTGEVPHGGVLLQTAAGFGSGTGTCGSAFEVICASISS